MKKNREKAIRWSAFSFQKKTIWIIIGFVVIIIKIIALIDIFKNYRHMERKYFIRWILFLILIPPAPVVYFIMTRAPKYEKIFTKPTT